MGELGGKGNVASIRSAIEQARHDLGYSPLPEPWYFPDIGEYAILLEKQGFKIDHVSLFNRPTTLKGNIGLRYWVGLFGQVYLEDIRPENMLPFFLKVEELARPQLWRDGTWLADYKRLRFVAMKK